ncbi:phage tail tape measure protein [Exiguobacterium sp. MER 193]|uniref:phage tail tape measure protein n=1 Tax=Exiguobacterium sp. MER 193 TaxID=2939564 RepID=UPI00203D362E|nr:phage tail tape measure protein [Exiguobacterium sp. MER 193]MCM3281499.1 phage tail tape measure protein [Exiguobacterium sp. MER 193]
MSGRDTEIQVDFNVSGVEQVERGDKALDKLDETAKKADGGITGLGERMTAFGGQMQATGANITAAGTAMATTFGAGALAMGAALGSSVSVAMDFESQLSRVGAIADATAPQMDALRSSALDLGASTSKSASEVALAQENLAALGFTVDDIIGAMPGVISAAEASGADMAQTADIMASAINIFGLEASEATRVADILAQTANVSAADINDMGYALKYAGPVASQLGVSMEELSASIGIMTNAGLDGSSAGTALRAGLLSLLNPSEENSKMMSAMGIEMTDANGKFIGLSGVVENLSSSMEGMTDAQKTATLASLVGTEASSGFLSLMSAGPAEIDKFTKSLEGSAGASGTAATRMMDNLKGSVEEMSGAFESAQIAIGSALSPALRGLADTATGVINKFNSLSPATQKMIAFGAAGAVAFMALVAVLGIFLVVIGNVVMAVGAISTVLGGLITTYGSLGAAASAILGPIGLVIGVLVALGATFYLLWTRSETFRNGVITLWESLKSQFMTALNTVVSSFQALGAQLLAWWQTNGTMIMAAVQNVVNYIVLVFQTWLPVFQGIWAVASAIVSTAWSIITALISGAISVITGIITFFAAVFTGNWSAAYDAVASIVSAGATFWTTVIDSAMNLISSIVSTVLDTVYQTFQNIWNNITGFLEGIDLYSIGSDIMSGLLNGIADMGESVLKKAQDIASNIASTVAGVLGVKSPSRVMMEIGMWTSAGMAIGMEEGAPMVEKSSAMVADSAIFAPPTRPVSNTSSTSTSSTVNRPEITININGGGNATEIASNVRSELEDWFASLGSVSPRSIEV